MVDFIPDLSQPRKVTLIHNYDESRNDEIRERFQNLYDRIAERVYIEHSRSLAPGVMSDLDIGESDELLFGGGTNRLLSDYPDLKLEVFERIRQYGQPAVGVCFGYQVLGRAYGSDLIELPERRNGLMPVQLAEPVGEQAGGSQFEARLIQGWTLSDVPEELRVLAHDQAGNPMAFVHNTLPVGGTQFHPEIDPDAQPGAVDVFGGVREDILANAKDGSRKPLDP